MVLGVDSLTTSLLLGPLSLVGCDVPKDHVGGENEALRAVNGTIFDSAGLSGQCLSSIPANWMASPKAAQFRASAAEALEQAIGRSYLFAFGGSDFCRLLPFWQDVLGYLKVSPCYVLTVSDPALPSGGLSRTYSQFMWLRMMLDAERLTRGQARLFVPASEIKTQWRTVIETIGKKVDLSWPRLPAQVERKVKSWLVESADETGTSELASEETLSDWAQGASYVMNRWAVEGEDAKDYFILDAIREAFDEASNAFTDVIEQGLQGTIQISAEALAELDLLREKIQLGAEEAETLRLELKDAARLLEKTQEELQVSKDKQQQHRDRISYLESALRQRETEADDYRRELEQVRRAARNHEEKLAALTSSLRLAERANAAINTDLEDAEKALSKIKREREQDRSALDAKEKQLELASMRLEQESAALDAADRKRQAAEGQLRERYGEVVTLTRMIAEAREAQVRSARNAEWAAAVAKLFQTKGRGKWERMRDAVMPTAWHRTKMLERLKREGLFDAEAYLALNPDVAQAGVDPLRHFLEFGIAENRPTGQD